MAKNRNANLVSNVDLCGSVDKLDFSRLSFSLKKIKYNVNQKVWAQSETFCRNLEYVVSRPQKR